MNRLKCEEVRLLNEGCVSELRETDSNNTRRALILFMPLREGVRLLPCVNDICDIVLQPDRYWGRPPTLQPRNLFLPEALQPTALPFFLIGIECFGLGTYCTSFPR